MQLQSTPFANGMTLYYLPEDKIIGGQVKKSGAIEPFEEKLLLSFVEPGQSVIDSGANIGVYTLQLARKVGKAGTVYAFEPEPVNFSILTHNLQVNNFSEVEAYEIALADKKSTAKMYLSWDNFGDHRIYDAEYRRARNVIDIQVDTLDHLLFEKEKTISLIKSDTQGYEPFVLKGAKNIITRDKPIIFLEYWPFGMEKAHADTLWMLDFLEQYYSGFIIDGKHETLKPLVREHLNDFTTIPGNEEGHSNLLFLDKLKEKVVDGLVITV